MFRHHPAGVRNLIGYFGASTGAAAALLPEPEPDVASPRWCRVRPSRLAGVARGRGATLLLVGGGDA